MTTLRDITCPFCSLLCDDLSIKVNQQQLSVVSNGCRFAEQGFSRPVASPQAFVKQSEVSHVDAVKQAAKILKKARKPLITGLGTDVNGMRAALHLAEKTNAIIRHKYEDTAVKNLKVMQSTGWIMTTLAEIKNRADLVIFIGDKVTADFPRFIEKFITPQHAQFVDRKQSKKVIYLGTASKKEIEKLPDGVLQLNAKDHLLANELGLLKKRLFGHNCSLNELAANKKRRLTAAADMIMAAEYPVFIWSAASLPSDNVDLLISSISDLIRELNKKQRAAGFSLADKNAGGTLQQVASWQTGYPAGISFTEGYPISTPGFEVPEDVDALLWISSLEADKPPTFDIPTVVISNNDTNAEHATVYLPIGVPGLDHSGNLFRTDAVINLPLTKLRDNSHHSAAETINLIINQL